MGDLFRALEKFLFRDLTFLLGGSVLLYSFFYSFGKLPTGDINTYDYLILAGISYTIGYSLQELFALLRLVRTKAALDPCWIGLRLYCCFEKKENPKKTINPNTYYKAKHWLYTEAPDRFRHDYERTESLKQVGTAVGPCFVIAGLLLIFKSEWECFMLLFKSELECFMLLAGIGLFVLGIILILLGWLKVTQQGLNLIDLHEKLKMNRL